MSPPPHAALELGFSPPHLPGLPALLLLPLPCFSCPASPLSSQAPGRDEGSAAPAQLSPSLVLLPHRTQDLPGISSGLGSGCGVQKAGSDAESRCLSLHSGNSFLMDGGAEPRGGSQTPPELVLFSYPVPRCCPCSWCDQTHRLLSPRFAPHGGPTSSGVPQRPWALMEIPGSDAVWKALVLRGWQAHPGDANVGPASSHSDSTCALSSDGPCCFDANTDGEAFVNGSC